MVNDFEKKQSSYGEDQMGDLVVKKVVQVGYFVYQCLQEGYDFFVGGLIVG